MGRNDGTKNNHAVLFLCFTTDIVNHVKCNISEIFFTSQHNDMHEFGLKERFLKTHKMY